MVLSRNQLDRLGARLRDNEVPTADDRQAFDGYRLAFDDAHREVAAGLNALRQGIAGDVRLSTRRKTLDSTIAKLRRLPTTRLSRLEDIAGCRLVVARLSQQDALIDQTSQTFETTRLRDYRDTPQHGYRAVHVVVRATDGLPVEVQFRTREQDEWANISEGVAKDHDIAVKYGDGPAAVHVELGRLSDGMFRYDRFLDTPDGTDFAKALPLLLESLGAATSVARVTVETWPEE
jgi:ppGpp synthetase/RelA/SpoT-type nucleotidyltranferase